MAILTSYEGSNDDYENAGIDNASGRWRAQGFELPSNSTISSASIYGSRGSSASGSFDVEIRSGTPNGTLVYTQTYTTTSTLSTYGSAAWNEMTFTTPFLATTGVQYYLVLYNRTGSSYDEVRWARDNSSPTYASGQAYYKLGSGGSGGGFTAYTTSDFNFRISGTVGGGAVYTPDLRLAFI